MAGDKPLYVYYCKNSGKHALTTDCNLAAAPRRATDHALVLDTQEHMVKLYTTDGGAKFLRRARTGAVERQFRVNCGGLPIAYRTEPEGRWVLAWRLGQQAGALAAFVGWLGAARTCAHLPPQHSQPHLSRWRCSLAAPNPTGGPLTLACCSAPLLSGGTGTCTSLTML